MTICESKAFTIPLFNTDINIIISLNIDMYIIKSISFIAYSRCIFHEISQEKNNIAKLGILQFITQRKTHMSLPINLWLYSEKSCKLIFTTLGERVARKYKAHRERE